VVQGSHPNQGGHLVPEVLRYLSHQDILGYPEEQDMNKWHNPQMKIISLGYKINLI